MTKGLRSILALVAVLGLGGAAVATAAAPGAAVEPPLACDCAPSVVVETLGGVIKVHETVCPCGQDPAACAAALTQDGG